LGCGECPLLVPSLQIVSPDRVRKETFGRDLFSLLFPDPDRLFFESEVKLVDTTALSVTLGSIPCGFLFEAARAIWLTPRVTWQTRH
jgi:hypothetical protein